MQRSAGVRAARSTGGSPLFMFVASIPAELIDLGLGFTGNFTPVSFVVALGLMLPSLAVTARRLHDIGRTGWWLLWYFVAMVLAAGVFAVGSVVLAVGYSLSPDADMGFAYSLVGAVLMVVGAAVLVTTGIIWLVMMVEAGDPGPNRYGPPQSSQSGHLGGHGSGQPGFGLYRVGTAGTTPRRRTTRSGRPPVTVHRGTTSAGRRAFNAQGTSCDRRTRGVAVMPDGTRGTPSLAP